jgi:hypothetical protein
MMRHLGECSRRVALGFRRLAIIDLTPAGHQPMVSASGPVRHRVQRRGVQLRIDPRVARAGGPLLRIPRSFGYRSHARGDRALWARRRGRRVRGHVRVRALGSKAASGCISCATAWASSPCTTAGRARHCCSDRSYARSFSTQAFGRRWNRASLSLVDAIRLHPGAARYLRRRSQSAARHDRQLLPHR